MLCLDSGEWSVCADVCTYVRMYVFLSIVVLLSAAFSIILLCFRVFDVFCGGDYGNS